MSLLIRERIKEYLELTFKKYAYILLMLFNYCGDKQEMLFFLNESTVPLMVHL